MSVEILAPVGGREQLIAAVRSGADAVYLGIKGFNARRNAENFEGDSLKEAVQYCHGRGVKVHVTMNTLVKDSELSAVYNEIEMLAQCGIDAVIVQDLAVAELFRRHCPSMPLHASTQMAIHSLEGAIAASELGFSRVVLARELTIDEIRKICGGCKIEIEAFVHGALCMCVSGMCYLSSILGERSGNRGLCAQPCRLDFRSGERSYALSLKDMSHISHIGQLIDTGVCSLKIEGRMKRPEYVSAAVIACREAVSGKTPDMASLRSVFSRSGFTDGYLTGKRGLDMFGYRTREDAEASAAVLGQIATGYRNELSRVPVEMKLLVKENEAARLEASDGSVSIAILGDTPEKALKQGTSHELALKSLSKTGGTPFVLTALTAELDESLMLSQGKLNSMRKEALEKLLEARSLIISKPVSGAFSQPLAQRHGGTPKLRVRLDNKRQIFDEISCADKIYLPMGEIDSGVIEKFGEKLICELPRLTYPMKEETLEMALSELKMLGLTRVCAGNLGSLRLAHRMGFIVHGGFDLNILNSESLIKYQSLGLEDTLLSNEINLGDATALGGDMERGIIGYGYLPLMIFRSCPAKGSNGCGNCAQRPEISDRTGARFKLICGNREYSTLHNHIPLYLGDKNIGGLDFVTLYFTLEDKVECGIVWNDYMGGKPFDGKFTRGLYYRRLK